MLKFKKYGSENNYDGRQISNKMNVYTAVYVCTNVLQWNAHTHCSLPKKENMLNWKSTPWIRKTFVKKAEERFTKHDAGEIVGWNHNVDKFTKFVNIFIWFSFSSY